MALLEVNDLKTYFRTDDGIVKAVDGVNFKVEKGKTLGIVGESGSGKSVTCLTIMGLNAKKNTITSGEALFNGENLISMPSKRLRDIRGNDIAMIFQDPMTSLNPGPHDRQAARRGDPAAPRRVEEAGEGARPRAARTRSGSRGPTGGSTTTRISSRAACASA